MEEKEDWRDVLDCDGCYQVSNYGRVRSVKRYGRKDDLILKQASNAFGYKICCIRVRNKSRIIIVHRTMALAFLDYDTALISRLVADHIDGNIDNNKLSNIRFVTRRFNASYGFRKNSGRITSKFVGVSWYKNINKWGVEAKINGKKLRLGFYENEEDAGNAYIEAIYNHDINSNIVFDKIKQP